MITIEFESGNVVIKGEKEDFQVLVDYKVLSQDILDNGGLSLAPKNIVFKVITDVDRLLHQIVGKDFIADFREKFPVGESGVYQKPFRGNLKKVIENMSKFKKEFKYTNEVILKATENMVSRHEASGKRDYIPQAHYFIYKRDRGSDLATECENILNGTSSEQFTKWR